MVELWNLTDLHKKEKPFYFKSIHVLIAVWNFYRFWVTVAKCSCCVQSCAKLAFCVRGKQCNHFSNRTQSLWNRQYKSFLKPLYLYYKKILCVLQVFYSKIICTRNFWSEPLLLHKQKMHFISLTSTNKGISENICLQGFFHLTLGLYVSVHFWTKSYTMQLEKIHKTGSHKQTIYWCCVLQQWTSVLSRILAVSYCFPRTLAIQDRR